MIIRKYKNILVITLSCMFISNAQQVDSLVNYSYDDLSEEIYEGDSISSYLSAKAYLVKAKSKSDTLKIANGFYFLTFSIIEKDKKKKDSLKLNYNDSIINYTKHLQKHEFYPSYAFSNKGDIYYLNQNFKEALENYLLALEKSDNNMQYLNFLYHRIGILKMRFNQYEDGLKLFKKINNYYIKKKSISLNNKDYLFVLFSLSDAYLKSNHLDSASYYYDLGYKMSLNLNDKKFKSYFIFGKGVLEYHRDNFNISIDSISKSIPVLRAYNDLPNTAYGYYFLGKASYNLGNIEKSMSYFKKVDSIFNLTNDLHPDLRETYSYLTNFYKRKKDYLNQLKFTNQVLKLDSIFYENNISIQKNIYEKFDREVLVKEKTNLIKKIKGEEEKNYWMSIFLFIISIGVVVLIIITRKRKKRFEQIYRELRKNSKFEIKPVSKLVNNEVNISKNIKDDLLKKLEMFEKDNGFLDLSVRLASLSKRFKTNSRYLSIVINNYKHKNFVQYINDLRIEFVIDQLNKKTNYRKYSIEGIAIETGFKSAESFSKAFLKKTGVYPSLYIKSLNKK
jgi:AraC-like DNA-binding protein